MFRTIVLGVMLAAAPAAAQLGKMLGDAANTANQAAGAVGAAQQKVQAAEDTAKQAGDVAAMAKSGTGLTDVLVSQLGVTQPQATGGAGALFALAKTQMPASDFSKVAAGVPGIDALLAAAPTVAAGKQGMAGAALGALGSQGGSVGAAAQLASSFSQLGMSSGMAAQFIPVCVQYLQGTTDPATAALLQSALQ